MLGSGGDSSGSGEGPTETLPPSLPTTSPRVGPSVQVEEDDESGGVLEPDSTRGPTYSSTERPAAITDPSSPCAAYPCANGSECFESPTSDGEGPNAAELGRDTPDIDHGFVCICPPGFVGALCERGVATTPVASSEASSKPGPSHVACTPSSLESSTTSAATEPASTSTPMEVIPTPTPRATLPAPTLVTTMTVTSSQSQSQNTTAPPFTPRRPRMCRLCRAVPVLGINGRLLQRHICGLDSRPAFVRSMSDLRSNGCGRHLH